MKHLTSTLQLAPLLHCSTLVRLCPFYGWTVDTPHLLHLTWFKRGLHVSLPTFKTAIAT